MIDGWRERWLRVPGRRFSSPWSVLVPLGLIVLLSGLVLLTKGSPEDDRARSGSIVASSSDAAERPRAPSQDTATGPQAGDDAGGPQAADRDLRPEPGGGGEPRERDQPDAGAASANDDRFRIATVRSGATVAIYRSPGGGMVKRVGTRTEFGSRRVFSVVARRGDWLRVATALSANNRDRWIRADPGRLRFGTTNLSIHASLSQRVVQLRRNGRVEQRLPVTIGAPGTPTPTGRFAVTDVIFKGLNPVYGCCAIALSARQPNLQDNWTGGDRIAIHGSTGAIGTASSNGCLRATDPDVSKLADRIPLGAPVFIEN